MALASGIRETTRGVWGSRLGSVLVGLFATSVILTGVFPADAVDTEGRVQSQTTAGIVHFAVALLAYMIVIAGMFVLSKTFKRDARWRSFWPFSLALAFAALAIFSALFFLPVPNGNQWAGLYQRVFVGTIVSWLLLAAIRLRSIAAAPSTQQASQVG